MMTPAGRQRFKCTGCGLTVEGREMPNGEVRAYDRAGWDGSEVRPSLCNACRTTPEQLMEGAS